MKFSTGISVASALALAIGGSGAAFAKSASVPSGNLNLRIDGYEVYTPTGETAGQYTINGLGQVIGDSTGTLTGTLSYTQVDAATATEDLCNDTVAGTITAPTGSFGLTNGSFTASLALTSPEANPAGCGGATMDLLCNRTLLHHNFVDDLDAGTYHCVATSVTPAGGSAVPASLTVRIGSVEGANAPND
ncbi:MAG TPA: hypothetical protein VMU41_13930 [Candidatus Binataceae bacterium]|nr:hypothetical protein [Candidatus Binataceae bacterium]